MGIGHRLIRIAVVPALIISTTAVAGTGSPDLDYLNRPFFHSADTDTDWRLTLNELLRVIQLYNWQGLHCDETGEDGYAPGPGDTACFPYSADYQDGADWRIALSELLRVIQLFNSHNYRLALHSEDGFEPGEPSTDPVRVYHTLANNGILNDDGTIDITVNIAYLGTDTVNALGLQEVLPEPLQYDSIVGGEAPDWVLDLGSGGGDPGSVPGLVEFIWFTIPDFPVTFTLRAQMVPKIAKQLEVRGRALLRAAGPEYRSEITASRLVSLGSDAR